MALRAAILGAGFIGRNFVRHAMRQGYEISVLDHNECPAEWKGQLDWQVGDISREGDVACVLGGVDTVFHFVSSTVPGDIVDESLELRQNVLQMLQLLHLCVSQSVRQVVFLSSASVYGPHDVLPIAETASTDPISSHGIHKLAIEKYLQLFRYQHGLVSKIVRLSNPYGPGQRTRGRQGFIGITIGRLLAGEAMHIHGDGTNIRDFIHIEDVCEALDVIARRASDEHVFNVGSGKGRSLNDIIGMLRQFSGIDMPVHYAASRFVDISASVLDISRIRREFGWIPRTSLSTGLKQTLAMHGLGQDKSV
jgi:UDP-glucose 4-epimerase